MNITQQLVRELLQYDPETGVFTWRPRDERWFKKEMTWKTWNTRFAGTVAGNIHTSKKGYSCINIRVLGKGCRAHRLAWIFMTGEEPPAEIDHLDGDATNNTWKNLRDGSRGVNRKNSAMTRRNSSGINGVSWDKTNHKWLVQVGVSGRVRHVGRFASLDDAESAAREVRRELGFTDRHGEACPRESKEAT